MTRERQKKGTPKPKSARENLPLVTVLMPNHNGARFIAASIQSVLDQSLKNFELIVVEDASTDDSAQIVAGFPDPRVRLLTLPQNEHICVALNEGLKIARGKYIARLDSDDCWYSQKLEKQIAYMEAHPQCGATFTWLNVVDEEDRQLSAEESMFVDLFRAKNRPREQWVRDFFFQGSCLCHPSAVVPREVMAEMDGYRTSLVQIQDFDLWARIAKKHDLYVLEEPLMNYRHALKGGNISAKTVANTIRSHYETYNVLRKYFDDMSDEMFVKAFQPRFKRPDASGPEELLCERALLLLEPVFWGHVAKLAGMDLLAELLDREETRKILREKYYVTQMSFYELASTPALSMEDPLFSAEALSRRQLTRLLLKKTLSRHPRLYRAAQTLFAKR